jgi:hypothetical protein
MAIEPEPSLASWALDVLRNVGGRGAARDHTEDEREHGEAGVQAIGLPAWLRSASTVGEDSRAR